MAIPAIPRSSIIVTPAVERAHALDRPFSQFRSLLEVSPGDGWQVDVTYSVGSKADQDALIMQDALEEGGARPIQIWMPRGWGAGEIAPENIQVSENDVETGRVHLAYSGGSDDWEAWLLPGRMLTIHQRLVMLREVGIERSGAVVHTWPILRDNLAYREVVADWPYMWARAVGGRINPMRYRSYQPSTLLYEEWRSPVTALSRPVYTQRPVGITPEPSDLPPGSVADPGVPERISVDLNSLNLGVLVRGNPALRNVLTEDTLQFGLRVSDPDLRQSSGVAGEVRYGVSLRSDPFLRQISADAVDGTLGFGVRVREVGASAGLRQIAGTRYTTLGYGIAAKHDSALLQSRRARNTILGYGVQAKQDTALFQSMIRRTRTTLLYALDVKEDTALAQSMRVRRTTLGYAVRSKQDTALMQTTRARRTTLAYGVSSKQDTALQSG